MKTVNATILWSIVYTIIGSLIFILGLNLLKWIPVNFRDAYKIGLPLLLLIAWLLSQRYLPAQRTVWLAFFLVSLGWTVDFYLTGEVRDLLSLETGQLSGFAFTMVISTVLVSVPVLGGWWISGNQLSSIFLPGKPGMGGIGTGLAGLLLFGGLGILQGWSQGLSLRVMAAAIPLALVFSLANSFREELTYRAVLLKGFQANIGTLATIIVTTLVFAVAHVDVSYLPPSQIIFAVVLVIIGVVCSRIMLKTGSLWGAVLFHAGADVLLILGLLSSQQLTM